MKKSIITIFLLGMTFNLFLLDSAHSQDLRKDIVGVIDIRVIMRELTVVKDVNAQVKGMEDKIKADLKATEKKLKGEKEQIERQKVLVTPKIYTQKQKEFNQKANRFRREVEEKSRQLQQARALALKEIQENMIPLAENIATDHGATVVFDQNELLFADQSLDLTPQVIAELNKKLPKVVVKIAPLKKS
jgi:outer membrane protein